MFITFEGGEGTGKSTQSKLLAERLRNEGKDLIITREPGGSPGAELIRNLLVTGSADRWAPMSEALLMYAARADHWQNRIYPALQAGKSVICDRFADSSVAYQGYGRGLDRGFLETLYNRIMGAQKPTRTYVFDLDPKVGLERSNLRLKQSDHAYVEGRFESLDLEFHQHVREGFLKIAAAEPKRCMVIDASLPLDEIHELIWQDVCSLDSLQTQSNPPRPPAWYGIPVAVMMVIIKDNKVLLGLRQGTGYMDGYYALPGGKHEGGESLKSSAIREVKEELGITCIPEDLSFKGLVHAIPSGGYEITGECAYATFQIHNFTGEITNAEPSKCKEVRFFPIDELPENITNMSRRCILQALSGEVYQEVG
ncbi:MAG: dTMP kinase [Alphaproteobacteria bacterium]|nr:dTMP kinase [Alphaproteobacteria bacterium]